MIGIKMGIDFGSANLTVFVEGKGIVFCEPSVMVCDASSGKCLAMGSAAKNMAGKLPPSMYAISPIREGRIHDFDSARLMLSRYIERICGSKLFRPNILMCVPSTLTEIERQALFDVVMASGAGSACFVSEALAAAVGAGISLTEPKGACICDIGGDVTDCAVVTMGNIAVSNTVRTGGAGLTQAIVDHVLRNRNIAIGTDEAERIKHTAGCAVPRETEVAVSVCGKHCDSGLPVYFEITSDEVYEILKPHLENILNGIREIMEETAPELCADLLDSGIVVTGGTAKMYGVGPMIEAATGIKAVIADTPEHSAAVGIGKLLKNLNYLERNGYVFETGSGEKEMEER